VAHKIKCLQNIGKILVLHIVNENNNTMKKLLCATVMITMAFFAISCSKSNENPSPNTKTQVSADASLSDILQAGPWIIDFYDDEENKSANLVGYVFTFKSDGALSLKKDNESYVGQWQVLKEDGVTKLMINIMTITIVENLSDKWQLKNIDSAKLDMRNDDPKHQKFLNIKRV